VWDNHRRRRLSALSQELHDALHAIQPFQAELPSWNCLLILNDLARIDRHRAVHFVTSFASHGWIKHDRNLVQNVEVFPGSVADDGTLARFTRLGDFDLSPDNLDGNHEFEVEVAGVELGPGPNTTDSVRPWGDLEKRLRALHRAVIEYGYGLIDLLPNVPVGTRLEITLPTGDAEMQQIRKRCHNNINTRVAGVSCRLHTTFPKGWRSTELDPGNNPWPMARTSRRSKRPA
jgi:hypothetical protein